MAPDVDQFEPLPSTLASRFITATISLTRLLGWMRWDPDQWRWGCKPRGGVRAQKLPRINSPFSAYSWLLSHFCGDGKIELENLEKGF
jgi:hypothetical protein